MNDFRMPDFSFPAVEPGLQNSPELKTSEKDPENIDRTSIAEQARKFYYEPDKAGDIDRIDHFLQNNNLDFFKDDKYQGEALICNFNLLDNYKKLDQEKKRGVLLKFLQILHDQTIDKEIEFREDFGKETKSSEGQFSLDNWESIIYYDYHSVIHRTNHPLAYQNLPFEENDDLHPELEEVHKTIGTTLEELTKNGQSKDIDILLEFWNKNRNPRYLKRLAETISTLDSSYGGKEIVEAIEKEEDPKEKQRLVSLLYRVELGKIGISTGGIDYLGHKFDVSEHNNLDNFAQRITADGKVGIFDKSQRLSGFVQTQASDFEKSNESVKKEVIKITTDLLFYSKADESAEETTRRKEIVELFCKKYFETFMNLFPENTSVNFSNLNLKEQGWTLLYLDQTDKKGHDAFFDFANHFGESGIRSLIGMEYGANLGNELIQLSSNLEQKQAQEFLNHFSNIIQAAETLGGSLNEVVPENFIINGNFLSAQVTEAILRKNKDFITAAQKVLSGEIQIEELIVSMREFNFVLNEISKAIVEKGSNYSVDSETIDTKSNYTTWTMQEKSAGYKVNLTIRPEESESIVPNKETGRNEERNIDPGIRVTFVWPNKKKFGLRLDLDPHYKDAQFPNGRLSLDIGSRDSKIAEILDKIAPESGGHHNIQSFSSELSDPLVFKNLCEAISSSLDARYHSKSQ